MKEKPLQASFHIKINLKNYNEIAKTNPNCTAAFFQRAPRDVQGRTLWEQSCPHRLQKGAVLPPSTRSYSERCFCSAWRAFQLTRVLPSLSSSRGSPGSFSLFNSSAFVLGAGGVWEHPSHQAAPAAKGPQENSNNTPTSAVSCSKTKRVEKTMDTFSWDTLL